MLVALFKPTAPKKFVRAFLQEGKISLDNLFDKY